MKQKPVFFFLKVWNISPGPAVLLVPWNDFEGENLIRASYYGGYPPQILVWFKISPLKKLPNWFYPASGLRIEKVPNHLTQKSFEWLSMWGGLNFDHHFEWAFCAVDFFLLFCSGSWLIDDNNGANNALRKLSWMVWRRGWLSCSSKNGKQFTGTSS